MVASKKERMAEHFADKEREFAKRIVAEWDSAVPAEYLGYSLKRDVLDGCWGGRISKAGSLAVRDYLKEPTKFLLLQGPKGLGKSSMAATLGRHFVRKRRVGGEFRSMPSVLQEFSFREEGDNPLWRYSNSPIVVLDDIGAANEGITPHQHRCLWSLIDNRWSAHNKITILTTNMSIQSTTEGQGLMDWIGESAWDRIRHDLTLVQFTGESMREPGLD